MLKSTGILLAGKINRSQVSSLETTNKPEVAGGDWPVQPTATPNIPPRNKGSIAGLLKGNRWLISSDHKAGYLIGGGGVGCGGVGWPVMWCWWLLRPGAYQASICFSRLLASQLKTNPRGCWGRMSNGTYNWIFKWNQNLLFWGDIFFFAKEMGMQVE